MFRKNYWFLTTLFIFLFSLLFVDQVKAAACCVYYGNDYNQSAPLAGQHCSIYQQNNGVFDEVPLPNAGTPNETDDCGQLQSLLQPGQILVNTLIWGGYVRADATSVCVDVGGYKKVGYDNSANSPLCSADLLDVITDPDIKDRIDAARAQEGTRADEQQLESVRSEICCIPSSPALGKACQSPEKNEPNLPTSTLQPLSKNIPTNKYIREYITASGGSADAPVFQRLYCPTGLIPVPAPCDGGGDLSGLINDGALTNVTKLSPGDIMTVKNYCSNYLSRNNPLCACTPDKVSCFPQQFVDKNECDTYIKENPTGLQYECITKTVSSCSEFQKEISDAALKEQQEGMEALFAQAKELNHLKTTSLNELIGWIIRGVMGVIGSVALAMIVYAGLLWMTASGNGEKQKKATQILLWGSLGIMVIFASYAAVDLLLNIF